MKASRTESTRWERLRKACDAATGVRVAPEGESEAIPPLSRLGAVLVGTWALAAIAIYLVIRFEAHRRGGS